MVDISVVGKIADIAKIGIRDEQKEKAAKSLNEILAYVDILSQADTNGVKATEYIVASREGAQDARLVFLAAGGDLYAAVHKDTKSRCTAPVFICARAAVFFCFRGNRPAGSVRATRARGRPRRRCAVRRT